MYQTLISLVGIAYPIGATLLFEKETDLGNPIPPCIGELTG